MFFVTEQMEVLQCAVTLEVYLRESTTCIVEAPIKLHCLSQQVADPDTAIVAQPLHS